VQGTDSRLLKQAMAVSRSGPSDLGSEITVYRAPALPASRRKIESQLQVLPR